MTARRALLNAARSLVAAKGVKAATVAAIADKAGVAKGLLFYYFKNKENVVKAVADELEAAYTASLRALPRAASARASLHTLIAHHFAFLEKNPEDAQFMYQSAASQGRGAGAFYAHLYAGILERLRRGAADGEFLVQDAEELAYMLLGSLHGVGRLKLFEFKRDVDAAALLAAFYDKLLPPPQAREPRGA
jgi:Transcriptional regulator